MYSDFFEELIRMQAEDLAMETYGADYCECPPEHHYLLRLRAIDILQPGSGTAEKPGLTVNRDAA